MGEPNVVLFDDTSGVNPSITANDQEGYTIYAKQLAEALHRDAGDVTIKVTDAPGEWGLSPSVYAVVPVHDREEGEKVVKAIHDGRPGFSGEGDINAVYNDKDNSLYIRSDDGIWGMVTREGVDGDIVGINRTYRDVIKEATSGEGFWHDQAMKASYDKAVTNLGTISGKLDKEQPLTKNDRDALIVGTRDIGAYVDERAAAGDPHGVALQQISKDALILRAKVTSLGDSVSAEDSKEVNTQIKHLQQELAGEKSIPAPGPAVKTAAAPAAPAASSTLPAATTAALNIDTKAATATPAAAVSTDVTTSDLVKPAVPPTAWKDDASKAADLKALTDKLTGFNDNLPKGNKFALKDEEIAAAVKNISAGGADAVKSEIAKLDKLAQESKDVAALDADKGKEAKKDMQFALQNYSMHIRTVGNDTHVDYVQGKKQGEVDYAARTNVLEDNVKQLVDALKLDPSISGAHPATPVNTPAPQGIPAAGTQQQVRGNGTVAPSKS